MLNVALPTVSRELSVGLALVGAPLTTATLGAVGCDDQGIASGVNNTVGQLAGLMMIAILPAAAGLFGQQLDGPEFAAGYETAMIICAFLALAATPIAAVTIGRTRSAPVSISSEARRD